MPTTGKSLANHNLNAFSQVTVHLAMLRPIYVSSVVLYLMCWLAEPFALLLEGSFWSLVLEPQPVSVVLSQL